MTGFASWPRRSIEDGALNRKVKEMMTVVISITVGCEGCIAYHEHDAVEAGATRAELIEAVSGGLMMRGCPGSIYPTHALEAIDHFQPNR
jgi:AhpD family alkylhydroperoxidase